ncbi:MAG: hypothetical protein HND56_10115 [Pseudomonadota bacterium]|nr:hypothetical protein [Pseudomonadota bacterium]QKK06020.1 MAG: hypothetical protein HND56_10115 [Pseudomonadota bacterium]
MMRLARRFFCCLCFFISLFPAAARAGEPCPIYQAVFKPHPAYYTAEERALDYRMTVTPPPAGKKGMDRWHDFIIHVRDAATAAELSRYRMSLAFPFGGIIPTIDGARFYPANEDFSRNGNYETAPHALILPNFGTRFRHANWEKSKRITFLTDAKTPPGPETPELWMLESCTESK